MCCMIVAHSFDCKLKKVAEGDKNKAGGNSR